LQPEVALAGERIHLALEDAHVREAPRDLQRRVGGEAVDDDHVARPGELAQCALEVRLLVAGEDQRRDVGENQGIPRSARNDT
jgi:hypothetical protein